MENPSKKFILSCTLGTFLEFFDYTLYGYFVATIGELFFPNQQPVLQIIATLAIFSIGFLVRPLGSIIFGHIADRYGRKKVLPLSILLMSFPTFAIGCLPTFTSVNWLAPFLLLLCRIIQGIALSAEYNGASIFILENNWPHPGFLSALTPYSCGLGMLAASLLAYLFSQVDFLRDSQWHWRLPFLLAGGLVGTVAWYMRRTIKETQAFSEILVDKKILARPLLTLWQSNKRAFLANVFSSAYMCSASYLLLVYLPTFLNQQYHMAYASALIFTSSVAFIEAHSALTFGWLSDFMGRIRTLCLASAFMIITAFAFILSADQIMVHLMLWIIGLAIILGAFDGPLTAFLPELFPTAIRYSATSVGYNIGGAMIGGLAPFVITLILRFIPNPPLVLGCYLGFMAVFALVFIHLNYIRTSKP